LNSSAWFEELSHLIRLEVPDGEYRVEALARIERRLNPAKALENEGEMTTAWAALQSSSPARDLYEKSLAEQLRETDCAAEGAPYVLQGLVRRLEQHSPFGANSREESALAAAFLKKQCAGAYGLSKYYITRLEAIRDRTLSHAPKRLHTYRSVAAPFRS
jgi:hypothetical protein